MNTNQLDRAGKRVLGYRYLGTFPLDRVPQFMKDAALQHFIINTQTSNLAGQHWIAVTIVHNSKAYIFDSFGQAPPTLLVNQLKQRSIHKIYYNKRQLQPFNTTFCGQLALIHLINADFGGRIGGLSHRQANLHQRNLLNKTRWNRIHSPICQNTCKT